MMKPRIEAIAVCAQRQDNIAIVSMNMMMSKMVVETAIRALQRINPQVKIIVFSGLNLKAQTAETMDLEVQEFLSKPYNSKALLETINSVLNFHQLETRR